MNISKLYKFLNCVALALIILGGTESKATSSRSSAIRSISHLWCDEINNVCGFVITGDFGYPHQNCNEHVGKYVVSVPKGVYDSIFNMAMISFLEGQNVILDVNYCRWAYPQVTNLSM